MAVEAHGVIINTTGEPWSEVVIACMMNRSEGSVREGLPLYGKRRLADALGNKRYSSKIIKAGALLPDTKLLLETWDTDSDVESNLERVREENLLGKSSRSRVEDVLRVFRQRNLEDPEMLRALATLRDFGVLEGSVKKRIAYVYLPVDAFAFIAFQLMREGLSGERLVHDSEWRLFFLPQGGAERFFLEAHQEGILEYYAAGRVVRIDFPVKDLEDYAGFLAQR